jgi:hypothetical protein
MVRICVRWKIDRRPAPVAVFPCPDFTTGALFTIIFSFEQLSYKVVHNAFTIITPRIILLSCLTIFQDFPIIPLTSRADLPIITLVTAEHRIRLTRPGDPIAHYAQIIPGNKFLHKLTYTAVIYFSIG